MITTATTMMTTSTMTETTTTITTTTKYNKSIIHYDSPLLDKLTNN